MRTLMFSHFCCVEIINQSTVNKATGLWLNLPGAPEHFMNSSTPSIKVAMESYAGVPTWLRRLKIFLFINIEYLI